MPFGLDPWLFWGLLSLVLFILEIVTPGFFLACLGIGAAIAVIPCLLDLSFAWQLACFSLGSLLSIIFLHPWLNRPRNNNYTSSVDRLIGRRICLTQDLPAGSYCELPIDGDVWRVEMRDKSFVPAGTILTICDREGIVLLAQVSEH